MKSEDIERWGTTATVRTRDDIAKQNIVENECNRLWWETLPINGAVKVREKQGNGSHRLPHSRRPSKTATPIELLSFHVVKLVPFMPDPNGPSRNLKPRRQQSG